MNIETKVINRLHFPPGHSCTSFTNPISASLWSLTVPCAAPSSRAAVCCSSSLMPCRVVKPTGCRLAISQLSFMNTEHTAFSSASLTAAQVSRLTVWHVAWINAGDFILIWRLIFESCFRTVVSLLCFCKKFMDFDSVCIFSQLHIQLSNLPPSFLITRRDDNFPVPWKF